MLYGETRHTTYNIRHTRRGDEGVDDGPPMPDSPPNPPTELKPPSRLLLLLPEPPREWGELERDNGGHDVIRKVSHKGV